ncbi:MAG TPA: endonuclease III [Thermoclostridium caenicola]|uniref:endonuclease III n=1 Tax=Thermoclostridium caenicola TaxID=659425 RepID=UPI002B9E478D|nr:endonuclease III [Thermoclostridium caenicola]HOK43867.1 endonuclease III [Thermoclostridium caenicola]HOL84329.1 endonuclease III [Thermoclostridium caenicola]HPO76220.1 endonuclease III [Thermoclostridium caenicola]
MSRAKAIKILDILEETYPQAKCELHFRTPFQLLVATMLSAQSTDRTVNRITESLFARYPDVESFLSLTQEQLEQEIREIGLYRNKAKNILAMCRELVTRFSGQVPASLEDLTSLPGVGRKTANVVLSNAFNIPALAVDTHVFRVSNRIGLAHSDRVDQTEEQLTALIPKNRWSKSHHLLIWHGRRTCTARKPRCEACSVMPYCEFFKKI